MNAVDTNVLVRLLVRDDERQAAMVRRRLTEAEEKREVLLVPLLVVLELIWILQTVYEISRPDIIDAVNDLTMMPVFRFEALTAVQAFVSVARQSKTDLPDLLIGHSAGLSGCERILTFDKRAAKTNLFELLR
jgi:predicted nucleic-acid-binding protein